MKKYFLSGHFVLLAMYAAAQLPNGSFAPDFTLQDINGNTWHLYELLDQGKNVIIDFSATWCPPCWHYHESGRLNEFYAAYGPEGTNEYMVFFIEGDPETNLDCLYDLPDCSGSSKGDWTAGTLYPIINDDYIAWEYDIAYWPTFFHICPNKLVTQMYSSPEIDEMYALKDECAIAVGDNNAAVVDYVGFSGLFCALKEFNPAIRIQNLGHSPITSLSAACWVNGVYQQTVTWTGNVISFATAVVEFDSVIVDGDAEISVMVTEVNGSIDEDPANNEITAQVNSLEPREQNLLQLELRTDYYPKETYWEITDGNGEVIYKGGNPLVIGLPDDGGAYTKYDTTYFFQVPVPGDGCYQFSIYDGGEAGHFDGHYKITEPNGYVLLEGEDFGRERHQLFGIANATNPFQVNGAITRVEGFPQEFCSNYGYASSIELTNVGIEPITSVEVELLEQDAILNTISWSGHIPKREKAIIPIPLTEFNGGENILFRIKSINDQPDTFNYKNEHPINVDWNFTEDHELELEMQIDYWAYEVYWQLTNSVGEVIASGGNTKVGPYGGGAKIAAPGDPGAYSAHKLVKEQINLPANIKDCYTFLVVDDYGDGFFHSGYVSFTGRNDEKEVVYVDYYPLTFTTDEILLDVDPLQTAVQLLATIDQFRIYPNPAQQELILALEMSRGLPLFITVYNMLGEVMMKQLETVYAEGSNSIMLDVSSLANGVYAINIASGSKQLSQKFTITH